MPAISHKMLESQAVQGEIETRAAESGTIAEVEAELCITGLANLALADSDSSLDEVDDAERSDDPMNDVKFDGTACRFCSHKTISPATTAQHLVERHALTIPYFDRLTDLATFLGYPNTIVHRSRECMYCARQIHSTAAVRQHMEMKSHCKLDLSRDSDLLDF